jgi:acyl carrier protein
MSTPYLNALDMVRQALTRYTDTPPDQIHMETSLADLQIDSLTLAELMFELEDRLGTSIDEAETVPSLISDLVAIVTPLLQNPGATRAP